MLCNRYMFKNEMYIAQGKGHNNTLIYTCLIEFDTNNM